MDVGVDRHDFRPWHYDEVVDLTEREFADISRKTLDGTIGQYWSDSFNPNWGTYKAIQSRALKIIESGGRRHIVPSDVVSVPFVTPIQKTNPVGRQTVTSSCRYLRLLGCSRRIRSVMTL